MSSRTLFFLFIPFLAIVLLSLNLTFATHNPYSEKKSPFECGFSSFLFQNRTQFNVSFFIFALLFLLFDLEILLMYPYSVSNYVNSIYGLFVMLIFFVLLTIGFIFELGKNALTISSKQYNSNIIIYRTDLTGIITDIVGLLPQLSTKIYEYHDVISNTGINIFTDRVGNLEMEFPQSMPDSQVSYYHGRISNIDAQINHYNTRIRDLFLQGWRIETDYVRQDPDYTSRISRYVLDYKRIRELYPHLPRP